ncbi:MAG: tartrate dehydrogenase [Anaerolineae bacterium]|nr:tartrate dehydrogenase [Anaerolineae bacterium]
MKHFKIAVFPGDGIGPEVVSQALRVLEAVQAQLGVFALQTTHLPWGAEYWVETGQLVPPDFLGVLQGYDAILFGALGDPARVPDHLTLEPLIQIRQRFDQYACVRPARLFPGVPGFLANKTSEDIDLIVLRENSEGEYVNNGGRFRVGSPDEFALQTAIHTRRGIQRILRFGFELAMDRRQHLTMITKSNAQRYGFVLWDEILQDTSEQYPSVEVDKQHVDAAAMNMIRHPEWFDVVVASNLFGDILSEIGGIIGGGLGLAPSANINPERLYPSMFEPTHGSAPDIAGQGVANPVGAILSAAMMLDWLELQEAATCVRQAVQATLSQGAGTPDLGGRLSTGQMADRVIQNLAN